MNSLIHALAVSKALGHAGNNDRGDVADRRGQLKGFQVSEKLFRTADFRKFRTAEQEFDSVKVSAPLVQERAVHPPSADDPEAVVVDQDFV